jgi:hypothetical protein
MIKLWTINCNVLLELKDYLVFDMNRIGFCAYLLLLSNIFPLKYLSMTIGKFGGRMNTISFNVMKKCPNDNVDVCIQ